MTGESYSAAYPHRLPAAAPLSQEEAVQCSLNRLGGKKKSNTSTNSVYFLCYGKERKRGCIETRKQSCSNMVFMQKFHSYLSKSNTYGQQSLLECVLVHVWPWKVIMLMWLPDYRLHKYGQRH